MKRWPPKNHYRQPVVSKFNFAPVCQQHLRNLRNYYIHMIFEAKQAEQHEQHYYYYAKEALPRLDKLINAGAFDHLPEVV